MTISTTTTITTTTIIRSVERHNACVCYINAYVCVGVYVCEYVYVARYSSMDVWDSLKDISALITFCILLSFMAYKTLMLVFVLSRIRFETTGIFTGWHGRLVGKSLVNAQTHANTHTHAILDNHKKLKQTKSMQLYCFLVSVLPTRWS